ncbi:MAG: DUF4388 domain-containing protein [Desulfobacterales bacterium]
MDFKTSGLRIIENQNCPLYQEGDAFKVAGRTISLLGKPTCLTLMRDVLSELTQCQGGPLQKGPITKKHEFNCSGYQTGCSGTIRLRYQLGDQVRTSLDKVDPELASLSQELNNFSIFKTLKPHEVSEIISYFKIQEFKKGKVLLRKGDRGDNLFIILDGKVDIIGDYGVTITSLSRGEIFGEMSLLTGNPVSTKVKVVEDTRTMCMSGNNFRLILNRFSPLQMYFTRLLAQRLAKSNVERSKQVSTGMSGNFSEITVTELLQALNMTQKTGILSLSAPQGNSRICLKEGNIVHAEFKEMTGETAFFEIVKQKRGNFTFQPGLPPHEMNAEKIGDFMYLIMEAMNQLDEAADGSDHPEGA